LPSEGDADWAEASVGVTEEVVAYAWDATSPSSPAMPTLVVLAVEGAAPELADLRIELYPSHMSEGCF